MLTALISRRSITLLAIPLIAACGSPSGDTEVAETGADTSVGTSNEPVTSTSTDVGPTTSGATETPTATSATTTDDPQTTGGPTTAGADCGNDMREAGEDCDGADLGGQTCTDVNPSYIGGTLACGATCTFDAAGCMLAPDAALVTLNELTSDMVLEGPMAMMGDAIELYNAGMKAADLSGWKLADDDTFPLDKTYVFPKGTMLAPGEFKVLYAKDPDTLVGDYPFGISNKNTETILLADADGMAVDTVMVDGPKAVVSLCRLPDAIGPWAQCEQTFGAKNLLADTACGNEKVEGAETCDGADLGGQTCMSLGLGYTAGTLACTGKCRFDYKKCTTDSKLVLNELESTVDSIEIFNGGAASVDLSGWVLTDDRVDKLYDPVADTGKLVFAPGTTLAAKAYLVVKVGIGPGQHPFGLGASGDTVTLFKLAGPTVIDSVTYGADEALVSFCRKPNGPGGAWTPDCTLTMGAAN